jgi:hypothetical protein
MAVKIRGSNEYTLERRPGANLIYIRHSVSRLTRTAAKDDPANE